MKKLSVVIPAVALLLVGCGTAATPSRASVNGASLNGGVTVKPGSNAGTDVSSTAAANSGTKERTGSGTSTVSVPSAATPAQAQSAPQFAVDRCSGGLVPSTKGANGSTAPRHHPVPMCAPQ